MGIFFKIPLSIFNYIFPIVIGFLPAASESQGRADSGSLVIARLKYGGGGDWYNDPSAIPNLCRFLEETAGIDVSLKEAQVSPLDDDLYSYPFLFLTGHGRIGLIDEEILRLRTYLLNGGFLYADDDYGMDADFRRIMEKVLPGRKWIELPFSHGIYSIYHRFENGLPKIHEHDDRPPRGFGMFDDDGRLVVFYTYETNISDGWADPQVHQDPPEKREAALRMGANIVIWALLH